MVLEVLHEVEILGEEVGVVGQVVEVVFYELFGVLVVFIVLDDEVTILDEHIGQSLIVTCIHAQHGIIQLLGLVVVLLPDFKLHISLVGLQTGTHCGYFLVHLPGLVGIFPLLQVAPIEVEIFAEADEEDLVVPQHAQHFGVLVGFML